MGESGGGHDVTHSMCWDSMAQMDGNNEEMKDKRARMEAKFVSFFFKTGACTVADWPKLPSLALHLQTADLLNFRSSAAGF